MFRDTYKQEIHKKYFRHICFTYVWKSALQAGNTHSARQAHTAKIFLESPTTPGFLHHSRAGVYHAPCQGRSSRMQLTGHRRPDPTPPHTALTGSYYPKPPDHATLQMRPPCHGDSFAACLRPIDQPAWPGIAPSAHVLHTVGSISVKARGKGARPKIEQSARGR